VNCDKLARTLPDARARWTARQGVEQLHDAFSRHGVDPDEFEGPRFARAPHVRSLIARGASRRRCAGATRPRQRPEPRAA
jgi:hypothetical protein